MLLPITTLFLRFMGLLPLQLNHAVGAAIGWFCWAIPTRAKSNSLVNLSLCFPEKSEAERRKMARLALIESGKIMTETGWFWFRPRPALEAKIDVSAVESLFRQLDPSRALVIAAPHFGAWEICTLILSRFGKPLYLYRPPRSDALEPLIVKGRTRFGAELAPVNKAGLKKVFHALREGQPIGVLPDQEPDMDNGVFADFFGTPANTMTMLSKLINKADAQVIFLAVERKKKGQGYRVHSIEPAEAIADRDPLVAARALNETVERCIAINPVQYIWDYRRFRLLSDGTRRNYKYSAVDNPAIKSRNREA